MAQQLMLEIILGTPTSQELDIAVLKRQAKEFAKNIKNDADFEAAKVQLGQQAVKPSAPAQPAPAAAPAPPQQPAAQGAHK